jgi:uncharacterized protein involved in type VI secretion and phage assembly
MARPPRGAENLNWAQEVLAREVLADYPLVNEFEFRLQGTYEPETYVVQYEESDFAFL